MRSRRSDHGHVVGRGPERRPDGTLREDLRAFLRATADSADATTRRLLRTIAAAAAPDEATADQVRDRFLATRRAALGQILERAVGRGEITDSCSVLALDLIYRSMRYRLIFRVEPLYYRWADATAAAIPPN
jgi:hypothetical protein